MSKAFVVVIFFCNIADGYINKKPLRGEVIGIILRHIALL